MSDVPYDEDRALDDYLSRNFAALAAPDELSEKRRAGMKAKARYAQMTGYATSRKRAKATEAQIDEMLVESRVIQERIMQRISRDIRSGNIVVNRCPECSRIVRTPRAKQCLWCGNDWHHE